MCRGKSYGKIFCIPTRSRANFREALIHFRVSRGETRRTRSTSERVLCAMVQLISHRTYVDYFTRIEIRQLEFVQRERERERDLFSRLLIFKMSEIPRILERSYYPPRGTVNKILLTREVAAADTLHFRRIIAGEEFREFNAFCDFCRVR